jgi:hypothetical protein
MQQDDAVHVQGGQAPILLQIDKGVGKQFISAMWWSAAISGAAVIGLIATCFFIYATIGHVAVLQYDLFDLRAKMGLAHENTPEPPP